MRKLKDYKITLKKKGSFIFLKAYNREDACHRAGFTCGDIEKKKIKVERLKDK